MSIYKKTRLAAMTAATATLMAMGAASAATIDFTGAPNGPQTDYQEDGFEFDYVRIVSGNCDSASGPECGAENDNESSTLTAIDGSLFDVTSIWFQILGAGNDNVFTLTTDKGTVDFAQPTYEKNQGYTLDLSSNSIFMDIMYLTITSLGNGNIRFDDIEADLAPVPLPATGLMLLAGLGLFGFARPNRKS